MTCRNWRTVHTTCSSISVGKRVGSISQNSQNRLQRFYIFCLPKCHTQNSCPKTTQSSATTRHLWQQMCALFWGRCCDPVLSSCHWCCNHAISLAMHCPKTRHISTCATCDPAARGWHLKPRSRAAKHLGTHRYTQIQEKIKPAGTHCCPLFIMCIICVSYVYHMCIICVSYVYHVSIPKTAENCCVAFCCDQMWPDVTSISLIAHSQLPYFSRAALWLDLFVSCTWRLRLWEDPVTKSWF